MKIFFPVLLSLTLAGCQEPDQYRITGAHVRLFCETGMGQSAYENIPGKTQYIHFAVLNGCRQVDTAHAFGLAFSWQYEYSGDDIALAGSAYRRGSAGSTAKIKSLKFFIVDHSNGNKTEITSALKGNHSLQRYQWSDMYNDRAYFIDEWAPGNASVYQGHTYSNITTLIDAFNACGGSKHWLPGGTFLFSLSPEAIKKLPAQFSIKMEIVLTGEDKTYTAVSESIFRE